MEHEKHALENVKQAILLSEGVLTALKEGDSELAINKSKERQSLLTAIPFDKLTGTLSDDLQFAFNHLLDLNTKLSEASSQVKNEIGNSLGTIKKGVSGANQYIKIKEQ